MNMRYASVCSGVEAPTVAWHPLGWKPQFFSEIEKFPSAVLEHHYPDVPNHGDMLNYKDWPEYDKANGIQLLVGGTPCQSFSVAGLRQGLDDPRGNLMLTFLGVAKKYNPKWIIWENVPGVLSSNRGRDFGTFLTALGQIGYGFAYRVCDAQYWGVAQRRRRVFVVGCLGDWRRAAAVLFERESLSGHPAPSREARERLADTLTVGANQYSGFIGEPVEAVTYGIPDNWIGRAPENGGNATKPMNDIAPNLTSADRHAMAFQQNTRDEVRYINGDGQIAGALSANGGMKQTNYLQSDMQVRRLTPRETERLQGFPDNYTQIPWRNKAPEDCPDGPRYKAMGNSMAVPVMRWIGERIAMVDKRCYS